MRKVFLEDLPKWEGGKNKGAFKWQECIGYKLRFIYDDIEGWIEITNYNTLDHGTLTLEYGKKEYKIKIGEFKKCQLGNILGKYTSDFKIKIGTRYQDERRDITIIDQIKIPRYKKDGSIKCYDKYYKYYCNRCNFDGGRHYSIKDKEYKEELWVLESALENQEQGCSCCSNQIIKEGINDIPTTAPWMVKYFQGGYNEAKKYTYGSIQKIQPLCPDCGRVKDNKIKINSLYRCHFNICSCSDKISYGEKFVFSVLEQLNIEFQTQLTKTAFDWCKDYRYDFYFELNNEGYVIEVNGIQHYKETRRKSARRTLEQEIENDKLKKELAIKNGIKEENYIVINCSESILAWITQDILESNLVKAFDLSKIDWIKAEEFTCSNLVKMACEYKSNNPNMTTGDISKIMNINQGTVITYLKKGNKIGWCHYDTQEERIKSSINNGKSNSKPVEIFKDGISLGIFESAKELERQSEKLFGTKLSSKCISLVCNDKKSKYKGYTYRFTK